MSAVERMGRRIRELEAVIRQYLDGEWSGRSLADLEDAGATIPAYERPLFFAVGRCTHPSEQPDSGEGE